MTRQINRSVSEAVVRSIQDLQVLVSDNRILEEQLHDALEELDTCRSEISDLTEYREGLLRTVRELNNIISTLRRDWEDVILARTEPFTRYWYGVEFYSANSVEKQRRTVLMPDEISAEKLVRDTAEKEGLLEVCVTSVYKFVADKKEVSK